MNITEYTEYILWGGGALIGLVVVHGLWMSWRGRSARRRAQATPDDPAEQMHFDFNPQAGVIDGVVAEHAAATDIVDQDHYPAPAAESGDGEAPADDGTASGLVRPGRRIPVAGRRTEPTVPRNVRAFANGADAHAVAPSVERPVTDEEVAEVIVIWVMAKAGLAFDGQSLLRTLVANELKYAGNVFRKLDPNTRKAMFTVANGVEPGTFDLSDMESLATPRVVMLLRLADLRDPRAAFEEMLEVAQEVAVALDGELKDERKNDLSGQTIEHYRQRIRDFKRVNLRP